MYYFFALFVSFRFSTFHMEEEIEKKLKPIPSFTGNLVKSVSLS